jgi:hypothetical protein
MLRSQDIVVLLKLVAWRRNWTFDQIAHELGLSTSAVHRSLERSARSGLYRPERREVDPVALGEFLEHGARYVFPPVWGGEARGMPTAWAAPPLSDELNSSAGNSPVWPYAGGKARGIALAPLHPSVPDATLKDEAFGQLLALVDALRIGGARERRVAAKQLKQRLRRSSVAA